MRLRKFEELKVSTRTIIASANVEFDMEKVFKEIPLTKRAFVLREKPYAFFIETIHYKNNIREWNMKDVMVGMSHKSFRNALNVVMILDDAKRVNCKVSKNGKFQITGCKELGHAEKCVFAFMEIIGQVCPSAMYGRKDLEVAFEIVMTNVDCGVGHCINRQSLDEIINTKTPYHSLLETSFGYTGVNIKFPVELDWFNMEIPTMEWVLNKPDTLVSKTSPLSTISPTKKIKKKYNTFLVFHSGQFIMSGMREDTMKDDYYRFINILKSHETKIKEVLDV